MTKDDATKNMDDSMDTMDMYQLFANQENNSNNMETPKGSESSKSPSPDTRYLFYNFNFDFDVMRNIYIIQLYIYSRQQKYFGTEIEIADVDTFINQHSSRSNLMIIIAKFAEFLCTKWNQEWPEGMSDIYLQAYTFMR